MEQPVPPVFNDLTSLRQVVLQQWRRVILQLATRFDALPVYANNAAAVAGGLTVGQLFRTGADPDLVCVVH